VKKNTQIYDQRGTPDSFEENGSHAASLGSKRGKNSRGGKRARPKKVWGKISALARGEPGNKSAWFEGRRGSRLQKSEAGGADDSAKYILSARARSEALRERAELRRGRGETSCQVFGNQGASEGLKVGNGRKVYKGWAILYVTRGNCKLVQDQVDLASLIKKSDFNA